MRSRALARADDARLRLGLARRPLLLGAASALRAADGSVDAARRPRARDAARADRHPGHLQRLPEPRAAREDGGDRRRAVERPADPRTGLRLVRRRVRGLRLRVPRRAHAPRAARRVAPPAEAPVDRRPAVVRRPALPAAGGLVRAEAARSAASAHPDRRRRREGPAPTRRASRRHVELRGRAGGAGAARSTMLRRHCAAEGRPLDAIERTWFGQVIIDADAARARARAGTHGDGVGHVAASRWPRARSRGRRRR